MLRACALALLLVVPEAWGQSASSVEDLWAHWATAHGASLEAVLIPEISRACEDRAAGLVAEGVLSHGDGKNRGPGEQMIGLVDATGEWGEVLGAGKGIAEVFQAWLASPSHRAILADSRWTKWGWGRAQRGQIEVYVVRFWRP